MSANVSEYVERRNDNIYVGSSRVTLESIVVLWRRGERPEEIREGFPTVSLAAIYGSIAYYLDHQEEIDNFLRQNAEMRQRQRAEDEAATPEFHASVRERFAKAYEHMGSGDALQPSKP